MTRKTFKEMVEENPDAFDFADARPGPSTLSEEYLASVFGPEIMKMREERRPDYERRMAEAAKLKRLRPAAE